MSNSAELSGLPYLEFDAEGVAVLKALAQERMAKCLRLGEDPEELDIAILDTMGDKNAKMIFRCLDDMHVLAARMLDFAADSKDAMLDIMDALPASTALPQCEEREKLRDGALELVASIREQIQIEADADRIIGDNPIDPDQWLRSLSMETES